MEQETVKLIMWGTICGICGGLLRDAFDQLVDALQPKPRPVIVIPTEPNPCERLNSMLDKLEEPDANC